MILSWILERTEEESFSGWRGWQVLSRCRHRAEGEDVCLARPPCRSHTLLDLVVKLDLERMSYKVRKADLSSQVLGNCGRSRSVMQIEAPGAHFPSDGSEPEDTVAIDAGGD